MSQTLEELFLPVQLELVQCFRPRLPPEAINFLTVHTNDEAQITVPPENSAEHVVKFVERHLIEDRDQADDHWAHLAQNRSQDQAFERGCFNHLSRLLGSPDPRLFGALLKTEVRTQVLNEDWRSTLSRSYPWMEETLGAKAAQPPVCPGIPLRHAESRMQSFYYLFVCNRYEEFPSIFYMNWKTLVLPIFGAIAVTSLQAQAQTPEATTTASPSWHEHHYGGHHHAWFWKKLNFTESQRAYIKQLRQNNKATIQPALLQVLKDRQALQQAIAGNVTSSISSDATKLGIDQGALISARGTLRAQILNYIMTSGTTEQKNLLSEWQQKKATWLQDKINRVSSNSGS